MAPIILPGSPAKQTTHTQVNIHIQAEVLAAETIRRQANVWLLENAGNLLRAGSPELLLGDPLVWRMMIVLTSPTQGEVGWLGYLEMDAVTGQVLINKESLIQEVLPRAQTLVAN